LVGRGQPPKKPEDIKKNSSIMFSSKEREAIEEAREETGERFGQFVRNAANEKATKINKKKNKSPA